MTLHEAELALSILCSAITALVFIVRSTAMLTEMKLLSEEFRASKSKLDMIQLHGERLSVNEREHLAFKDAISSLSDRVQGMWMKIFSHDKHLAVLEQRPQSQHEILVGGEKK